MLVPSLRPDPPKINFKRSFQGLVPIAAVCLLLFAQETRAQVVLTFDDVPAGLLTTQYLNRGVTFNSPLNRDSASGLAHSGTKAIELCFATEFCRTPLNVTFTTAQRRVKIFAGVTSQLNPALPVLMRALNASGATVAQATVMLGPSNSPIPVQVPIEVTSATANIKQIVVGFDGPNTFNNGLVFDDLEFDTAGPAAQCFTEFVPVVTLLHPVNNLTTQLNTFLLQGHVNSGTPLIGATLSVSSTTGSRVNSLLGVTIQPSAGPFGTNFSDSLFPGTNIVTVTAQNCFGTGQASAIVNFMPVAGGTMLKLLGMEITQATQDLNNSVPLVAGKPTGVRLYFSTTGGMAPISNVRADISGFRVGGFTPFLAQSIGSITVDSSTDLNAKRRDSTKSLNFILTPDFSQQGLTRFRVDRLYVDGVGGARLACDGCVEWSAGFVPVRPLNLVVAPFVYLATDPPVTADAGTSLMSGLSYLNNVFPLPGNFPTDTAGIRLLMLLPTQSTQRVLPQMNSAMLSDLENILDDLMAQPGNTLPADTRILGVSPSGSGGVANWPPGKAAYGDIRAIEHMAAPTDPEKYGSIWAQEIAHNFGRQHVSSSHGEMPPTDPDFPCAHGGICEPGYAITTEGWNGTPFVINPGDTSPGARHAHDFMSYGANDRDNHSFNWVSPFTYRALLNMFQTPSAIVAPHTQVAEDKVAIRGSIDAGVATLGPFHLTRTTYAKSSGDTGELSAELIDAAGRTLSTHRFNATAIKDSPVVMFSEYVPWKPETEQIVLKRGQTVLATRYVSANKPTVRVTAPRAGQTWGAKGIVKWQAADRDGDALTYTVFYNNGTDERWIPIATDVTTLSASIDTRLLVGSNRARVRVRATDGVNTTEAESAAFIVPEQGPLVAILRSNNLVMSRRQRAEFTGAAYDPRDGMLPATQLRWTSNRDNLIGSGRHIRTQRPLSRGRHIITLTATNSQGKVTRKTTRVTVR